MMTAVIVQVAQSLSLNLEEELAQLSPCEAEIRRRIWYSILNLDLQTSIDRGMRPIVSVDDFTTQIPLNLDDVSLQHLQIPRLSNKEISQSALIRIAASATGALRSLGFVPVRIERAYNFHIPMY
jgi:hypothetical protein